MKANKFLWTVQYVLLSVILLLCGVTVCHSYFKDADTLEDEFFMERAYIRENIAASIQHSGRIVDIEGLRSDTVRLVCAYSSQACGSCISFAKSKIKEALQPAQEKSYVLYLVSNFNARTKFKDVNTLNLGSAKSGLDIENAIYACYFTVKQGRVDDFFIPEKSYPEYTEQYLKRIKEKYFRDR